MRRRSKETKEGDPLLIAGNVKPRLHSAVGKLHDLGYTNTEIVNEGIRLLAKREKVAA